MGKITKLGDIGRFCVGDDIDVVLEVLNPLTGIPVDVSGWTSQLVISKSVTSAALLTASGTVSGAYDADRETNTQRITYPLVDTDTANLKAGDYVFSARRTNAGSERVLAFGPCLVERANQT